MNRGNFSRGARVNPPAPAKLSAPSAFVGFAALVRRDWPEISKEDYLLMAAAAWNVHEAAERDAALMKRRVDGLLEELRTGEQLMHRITGNAMLARPPIEFNDLEMANRWRMRVKLLHESGRLVLAAPDAAMQPQAGVEAIRQLRAQLAAAERDAARYRYLRDDGYGITIDVLEYDDDGGEDWVSGHSPADLDAAIDRFRQPDNGGIPSP